MPNPSKDAALCQEAIAELEEATGKPVLIVEEP
jgi:hypothetical protein